jgi:hypothetical protein
MIMHSGIKDGLTQKVRRTKREQQRQSHTEEQGEQRMAEVPLLPLFLCVIQSVVFPQFSVSPAPPREPR